MMTSGVTIEDYGMAIGGLWFQRMVDEGWFVYNGDPEINVQKCLDVKARAQEHDWLLYGEEGEDADEAQIALEMLVGCLGQALGDFDESCRLAAKFLVAIDYASE